MPAVTATLLVPETPYAVRTSTPVVEYHVVASDKECPMLVLIVAWKNAYDAPANVMVEDPVLAWLVRATVLCIPFRESKEKT